LIVFGLVPVTITRLDQPGAVNTPNLPPWRLVRRAPFAMIATFLAGMVTGSFWGMGAAFATRIGLSPVGVGAFVASVIGGGVIAQLPLGRLSNRMGRRPVLIGAALSGAAFALLMSMSIHGPVWLLLLFAFGFGAASLCLYALAVAHMNDLLDPEEVLAATQGLLLASGGGAALGPLIAGIMFDVVGARGLPYYQAAVLVLLAVIGILRSFQKVAPSLDEQGGFVPLFITSQGGLEVAEEIFEDLAQDAESLDPGQD
ncbi:MAG TPA: MFS transporter, partial [Gammaproteobacteria bacterium]|nr:MFS transporter [Gammaproteobacteria bacterium]